MQNFIYQWISHYWAKKALRAMHLVQQTYLAYAHSIQRQVEAKELPADEGEQRVHRVETVFKMLLNNPSQLETTQAIAAFRKQSKAFAKDPWQFSLNIDRVENTNKTPPSTFSF